MRNFEEFKGIPYRLDFDAASKSFVYVPLVNQFVTNAPKHEGEVIVLQQMNTPQQSDLTPFRKRRAA